ncbi:hypothetical protein HZ993_12050 [Rhodoferax sp. AJA081-3]|uniref:hypothetical protein n=1 Tax=Rhodoferax sp. AJA081-3 TaxID=2752316 RepID=UPI001ADF9F46|nr:hypothetical protein [Rhodoferax sp. AJA081-3]QTN30421.1 hypothetical protein HZ993_12050 [Rhodoferax sp. AJA081-3]
MFDLGVGRALTVRLSQLEASGRISETGPTLRAGMLLTAAAGLLGVALVGLLAPLLAHDWLKISPDLQDDARLAFLVAAVGVLPTTLASGLRGALEGLDRFAASNLTRIVLGVWMFALPAWSIFTMARNWSGSPSTWFWVVAWLCWPWWCSCGAACVPVDWVLPAATCSLCGALVCGSP